MPKKGHTKAAIAKWETVEATVEALEAAPPTGHNPWMDTKQAAVYLGQNADLLYEGVQRTGLKHIRVGGRRDLRFRQSWLDSWAESFVECHVR